MKKVLAVFLTCLLLLTGCGSSDTASNGDIVKIDFVGTMDGQTFSGGSATDQIVELGAGMYIEGFEEGIVGMKKGETKAVSMKFPESYYEELAGKDVTFNITVKAIYKESK